MDFEHPQFVPVSGFPSGQVQFGAAFPGWTALAGTNPVTVALSNNLYLDSSGISIIDAAYPAISKVPLDGSYGAIIQAGVVNGISDPQDIVLLQSGLVPSSSQSLRFKVAFSNVGSGALIVTLGGQQLSLIPLASGPNYTFYGADISSWAGQTAELDFRLVTARPHVVNREAFLDSIEFSDIAIPEPSVAGLMAAGGVVLAWRWKRGGLNGK